jgi:hypothetical protein
MGNLLGGGPGFRVRTGVRVLYIPKISLHPKFLIVAFIFRKDD